MNVTTKTCPLTGSSFTAILEDDSMTVTDPLTNDVHTYELRDGMVLIPEDLFEHTHTLSLTEASEALDVTKQRVNQLARSGKLPPRYVCGYMRFLERDVIRYKRDRKNGRPRKE